MFAVLLALCLIPHSVQTETCDLLEVNHYYNENGNLVFLQLICWDWFPEESEYHVVGYKLLPRPPTTQITASGYRIGPPSLTRRITAPHFRETWTQHDPELEDRNVLPLNKRRLSSL